MCYIIIKMILPAKGQQKVPVILLDGGSEVMEFETYEEAEEMCTRFQVNSDSNWEYTVKKIGVV